MGRFKDLNVWQRAKELAVEVYKTTQTDPFRRDFSLRDQMRRAAVSISSNIAEGDERGSNKDGVRFLYIAKGSLAELQTQLEIAYEIGYLKGETLEGLNEKCERVGKMLGSLIKVRSSTTCSKNP
ncbi:MAG: four helix bundle protein [Deltaproteobacteria bacterium]|nr:four helix bundle protein [Deltaproteobacteria bacterium]RLB80753.1 MAG: four helix bundle protein [Deltaproteobacteria bacterium]